MRLRNGYGGGMMEAEAFSGLFTLIKRLHLTDLACSIQGQTARPLEVENCPLMKVLSGRWFGSGCGADGW